MPTDDYQRLADLMLDFARKAIAKDGLLIPISAFVSPGGEVLPLRRLEPPGADDNARGMLEEILSALRGLAREKKARAVGWCLNMRVAHAGATAKVEALVLFCESLEREPMVMITPYQGAPGPGTAFAEPYVQQSLAQVFTAGPLVRH